MLASLRPGERRKLYDKAPLGTASLTWMKLGPGPPIFTWHDAIAWACCDAAITRKLAPIPHQPHPVRGLGKRRHDPDHSDADSAARRHRVGRGCRDPAGNSERYPPDAHWGRPGAD